MDHDLSSGFGSARTPSPPAAALINPALATDTAIPSAAQIREKKERRRRLAAERDFISLDDGDKSGSGSDGDGDDDEDLWRQKRSLIIPADDVDLKSKYGETRLVADDEDFAEGFDEFVEDEGRVVMSKKGRREEEGRRKKEIGEQIRVAEGGVGAGTEENDGGDEEGEEVDEEEGARVAAYEAAQTRAGTYGERRTGGKHVEREREEKYRRKMEALSRIQPGPVPSLRGLMKRCRDALETKRNEVKASEGRLEGLRREREEIDRDEEWIKQQLKEAGEKLERLRREAGEKGEGEGTPGEDTRSSMLGSLGPGAHMQGRGLESFGGMAAVPRDDYET